MLHRLPQPNPRSPGIWIPSRYPPLIGWPTQREKQSFALAIDTVTTGFNSGSAASVNGTTTVGGLNRAIFVVCATFQVVNPSCTCDGAAMTLVGQASASGGNGVSIFQKVNQATGTNVILPGNGTNGKISIITVTGCDQTTPAGTFVSSTATSTAVSTGAISCAVGDVVLAGTCFDGLLTLLTGGFTTIVNNGDGGQDGATAYIVATGTSHTFGGTAAPSNNWIAGGVAIKAAAATGGGIPRPIQLIQTPSLAAFDI